MRPVHSADGLTVVGLGAVGWLTAVVVATLVLATLTSAVGRGANRWFGPANTVTLVRALMVCVVAGFVADAATGRTHTGALVTWASVALALDWIDGQIARRTDTVTALGARFDMETDALLILVLSVHVARTFGSWVVFIGAARYLLWLAERMLPWLRRPVPPRYWRKTVAAIQGVTLTVVAADVLPDAPARIALVVALALLAESFGRDVVWLWHERAALPESRPTAGVARDVVRRVVHAAGYVLLWAALLLPDRLTAVSPMAFVRIPLEGLALGTCVVVLRGRARTLTAAVAGGALGIVLVFKALDIGFHVALDRPFDPVSDWTSFAPAAGVLRDSVGSAAADVVIVLLVVLVLAIVTAVPLSTVRLVRIAAGHRSRTRRGLALLTGAWLVFALFGVTTEHHEPFAAVSAADVAIAHVRAIPASLRSAGSFSRELTGYDSFRIEPGSDLLGALRGKDVLLVFVESYGQVALQDPLIGPGVTNVVRADTAALRDAGFDARSAFLTSPTFGGISWLAHSTMQSGLWVDGQGHYDQLVKSSRFTLSAAFRRAGWRTVADVPSNLSDWSEGTTFYHFDKTYGSYNVGYRGPTFSYATMPDQYTLSAFQRLELAQTNRRPVMAEIDLVTSHTPWAPLPTMVDWSAVGDGSVFNGQPAAGHQPKQVWQSTDGIKAAYGQSIQYSVTALTSFLTTFRDPNLVVIMLGDHQPAHGVTSDHASHNVPVSIIANDPKVFDRIASWSWQPGLLPAPNAPLWPMSSFRDQFLTAFATKSATSGAVASGH